MNQPLKTTPKDVFLQLFNIVTFYLTVIGFIMLCINYIDALFPDVLNYYFTSIASGVRVSSSIILISVPAYILTTWFVVKDQKAEPAKRELSLRKWLIYFTLFVSAITIIIDLMIFVYNFLNGELTIKFALKVFAVLLVAAAVFGFYLWDLKRQNIKSKVLTVLAVCLAVVMLAAIIAGFFIVGSPMQQRARKLDEQRLTDLQSIQYQIIDYWTRKDKLPAQLVNLEDNISGFKTPVDPETAAPYEYTVSAELKFELCATFTTSDTDFPARGKNMETQMIGPYPAGQLAQNWTHAQGRVCFERTIDPELYSQISPKVIR